MTLTLDTPFGSISATDADLAMALLELLSDESRDEADLLEALQLDYDTRD